MFFYVRFYELNQTVSFLQDSFVNLGGTLIILAGYWIVELNVIV